MLVFHMQQFTIQKMKYVQTSMMEFYCKIVQREKLLNIFSKSFHHGCLLSFQPFSRWAFSWLLKAKSLYLT